MNLDNSLYEIAGLIGRPSSTKMQLESDCGSNGNARHIESVMDEKSQDTIL